LELPLKMKVIYVNINPRIFQFVKEQFFIVIRPIDIIVVPGISMKYPIILFLIIINFLMIQCSFGQEIEFIQTEEPKPLSERAIAVIRRSTGVYAYKYKETLKPIDPHQDYLWIRKITSKSMVASCQKMLAETLQYHKNYKKRCLPVWDYAIEFRQKEASSTFLFSMRCQTLKHHEEEKYHYFGNHKNYFYELFNTELNDTTSEIVKPAK